MERTPNCCRTLASLVALVFLLLYPVRSGCKEDTYRSPTEAKAECCVQENAELKRFKDVDYDSFVGLMGRRSAAQPNGMVCPCGEMYLKTRRGRFLIHARQRFQRFL